MANVINSLKLGSGTYVFTTPYATCGTAAAEAAKVAATTPGSNFSLETGARITVKFTVTNTAANPTLNVNSTGAKAIYYRGSAISAGYLAANRTYEFVYNGTQYEFIGDIDTNTNTDTTTTTGATDTSSKIFLIGATSQSTAPTTYSHDTAYVGTDGCLYSNSKKVATVGDNNTFTGTNMFKGGAAQFRTSSEGLNDPKTDVGVYGILCQTGGNVGTYYKDGKITNGTNTLTLPSKTGTVALTSDIPTTSSFVTVSGDQTISGIKYFTDRISIGDYISIEGENGDGGLCHVSVNNTGSISYYNEDDNTEVVLNMPITNSGTYTIATTSDIPSTSSFVTLAGNNTYTGNNTYMAGAHFVRGATAVNGFTATNGSETSPNRASFDYNSITRTVGTSNYTLTIPAKTGTIALTSDIPSGGGSDVTAAGNNNFTGTNTFTGTSRFQSGNTYFTTASFMTVAGRPSDPVTTVDSDGVHCSIDNSGVGTHYQDNQIQNKAFTLTLPTKNGTLATTSDIPIKTATLSGTTLSITLS